MKSLQQKIMAIFDEVSILIREKNIETEMEHLEQQKQIVNEKEEEEKRTETETEEKWFVGSELMIVFHDFSNIFSALSFFLNHKSNNSLITLFAIIWVCLHKAVSFSIGRVPFR